jgi:HlyD family secretion protein
MILDLATPRPLPIFLAAALAAVAACRAAPPADRVRVSGQIEATDVQVAAPVGGRLLELPIAEGGRVNAGDLVAKLDTADTELALARTRAERAQSDAQLRLLLAGARPEEVRQADAQRATADSEVRAAEVELAAAQTDVDRFEKLLASNSGSRKQRDDAVARRDVAKERVQAARDRVRAAGEQLARIRAGSRKEEIAAARARLDAVDAQIATLQKALADASLVSPIAGVVTEHLADVGELLAARAPVVVVSDLDHVWADVYVDEPAVPRLRVGQSASLFTDAGGPALPGTVTFLSPRAEFTPRNVQTADDRSKLVYRVKVAAANAGGVLKAGMPVEAELPLGAGR